MGPCEHGNEPSNFVKDGDFLTSQVTISFSREILRHSWLVRETK